MSEPTVLLNVLKVFGLSAFSFFVAFFSTPLLTHYLYSYKMWIKKTERNTINGESAKIISNLTKERTTRPTPRMGGILVWATTLFVALLFFVLAKMYNGILFEKLNFLSRSQTWLPLAALIAAALIGFADDLLAVCGTRKGLDLKKRIILVLAIGLVGALWFYGPLETSSIKIPFAGELNIGIFFIPFFMLVMLGLFSTGVIDGLDGLAGGVLGSIIAAYGGIAFFRQQIDLATFLGVIGGALLAFLWYNIPPARFYMGETGMLGLTSMLTVVAFLTDAVVVLPIIAFPLVIEAASVIIQVFSKKFRGKKVFIAAPLHHHFEAKGWPHYKVTMRFWVVSVVSALVGMVIQLVGVR